MIPIAVVLWFMVMGIGHRLTILPGSDLRNGCPQCRDLSHSRDMLDSVFVIDRGEARDGASVCR